MAKTTLLKYLFFIFLFFALPLNLLAEETDTDKTEEKQKTEDYSAPLSGMVLMPTAYKPDGSSEISPALDINLSYFIGRLYGQNTYTWTSKEKNYLNRIGLWLLDLDGKLVVQSETKWLPAMAAGVQATFMFRDSPDPKLDDGDKVSMDKSDQLGSAFIVISKKIKEKFILSVGYSQGTYGNFFPQLSEFLSTDAIELAGKTGNAKSDSMLFGGLIFLLKPNYPITLEILVPQKAALNPKLINFRFGRFIKMNFQISYLFYDGGWDLLGMFQYRFNLFPRF